MNKNKILKLFNNKTNYVRLLFAMFLAYLINIIPNCKIKSSSGSTVKFRPKPQVFGIIWPILYICFGFSWIIALKKAKRKILTDILYILASIILASWIIVYSCMSNKIGGLYILFLNILSIIILILISKPKISKILLAPLLVWILFATFLNYSEVQK